MAQTPAPVLSRLSSPTLIKLKIYDISAGLVKNLNNTQEWIINFYFNRIL